MFRITFFKLLHSNIDKEIEWSLYLLIIKFIAISCIIQGSRNNHMSILHANLSKTKYCVFQNGMITLNSLPNVFKVTLSLIFDVQEQGTKFLSKKILRNIHAESHYDYLFF